MSFHPALESGHLWDGEMIRIDVDGIAVLLLRVEGEVHAYRDACAHLGAPLSQGKLCGRSLICRAHEWRYDAATGRGINPPSARLARLATRVRDGMIEIDVPEQLGKECLTK